MSELNHPNEINRDYVRLLQSMGRFIREEFSVSIRMTQSDAVEQLLHYAKQSENHVLQEMGKELMGFTGTPEQAPEPPISAESIAENGVRYYRGAPVVDSGDTVEKNDTPAPPVSNEKTKPLRVYRGQVING